MLRHHIRRGRPGFYFNLDTWDLTTDAEPTGVTPLGEGRRRVVRIPTVVMLIFAPIMGGLFAMFLPFIGFYLVAEHLSVRGGELVRTAAQALRQGRAASHR